MKALFIFAHPDDESFSSGGTIALLRKRGDRIVLVSATKGEAGVVGEPPLTTQDKLGAVREKEQRQAAKILGIEKIYYLGLLDGTLHKYSPDFLAKKILPILKKEKPEIVVTFDEHGVSNHPDHIAAGKGVAYAFVKYKEMVKKHVRLYCVTIPKSNLEKYRKLSGKDLAYKAFGEMIGTQDNKITTVVDIKKTFATKVRALRCHKTQHKDVERFLRRAEIVDLRKEFFVLVSENTL